MRFFVFVFALFTLAAPLSVQAKEMFQYLPTDLRLSDETGAMRSFEDLKGENGAILVFYRSAKWCPYCKMQLIDMNAQRELFEQKGYNLVAISYDSVEELAKFDARYKVDFPLLSDEGSKTIRAFGIFNEEHEEGSFAYGVPHPTIYVVNNDGEITASIAEESYKNRPTVDAVLELIE